MVVVCTQNAIGEGEDGYTKADPTEAAQTESVVG